MLYLDLGYYIELLKIYIIFFFFSNFDIVVCLFYCLNEMLFLLVEVDVYMVCINISLCRYDMLVYVSNDDICFIFVKL